MQQELTIKNQEKMIQRQEQLISALQFENEQQRAQLLDY